MVVAVGAGKNLGPAHPHLVGDLIQGRPPQEPLRILLQQIRRISLLQSCLIHELDDPVVIGSQGAVAVGGAGIFNGEMPRKGQIQAVVVGVDFGLVSIHHRLYGQPLRIAFWIDRAIQRPAVAGGESAHIIGSGRLFVAVRHAHRHAHHHLSGQDLPRQRIVREEPAHQVEYAGSGRAFPGPAVIGRNQHVFLVLTFHRNVRQLRGVQRPSLSRAPYFLHLHLRGKLALPVSQLPLYFPKCRPVPRRVALRHLLPLPVQSDSQK